MSEKTADPILVETGARIRQARATARLNLHDLARLTGISISALSHIETGKRDLRLTTLVKIAEALRVKPDVLLRPATQGSSTLMATPHSSNAHADRPSESSSPGYDLSDYE